MRATAALTLAAMVSMGMLGTSPLLLAQTPSDKDKKERLGGPATVDAGGMTKEQRLSLCLESWDQATHMSKREWKAACERSIKDYPDAFKR
jgi:hypothetical protein